MFYFFRATLAAITSVYGCSLKPTLGNDQATTILHQGMTLVAEFGFLVLPLAVELRVGLSNGTMGIVGKLLTLE